MEILINAVLVVLTGITFWFFFIKKEQQAVKVSNSVRVIVDGGYKPEVIEVRKGQPITIEFERRDPTSCLEEVVIPDFKVRKFLPLNQVTSVTLTPKKTGEYTFHCGMSMYFGKIKVV